MKQIPVQVPEREARGGELLLVEPVQEVGLVLALVARAQQPPAAGRAHPARVVAGRDGARAERVRVIEERAELDLAVAQHVGVRRAAAAVLGEEDLEHPLPVLVGQVHGAERDAQRVAHRARIGEILRRRAVAAGVVLVPVLHEHRAHRDAVRAQALQRDRRVHAAGHADHHVRSGARTTRGRVGRSGGGAVGHGLGHGLARFGTRGIIPQPAARSAAGPGERGARCAAGSRVADPRAPA